WSRGISPNISGQSGSSGTSPVSAGVKAHQPRGLDPEEGRAPPISARPLAGAAARQNAPARPCALGTFATPPDPHLPSAAAPHGDLGPAGLAAVCEAAVDAVPHNAVDVPVRIGLLPQQSDGWIGRPGLGGARPDGSGWAPRLVTVGLELDGRPLTATHTETGT